MLSILLSLEALKETGVLSFSLLAQFFTGEFIIDLADLAFDLLIFENQISSLSSNTLIGVSTFR